MANIADRDRIDELLADKICAASNDAAEAILRAYGGPLRAHIAKHVRDPDEQADILGDAILDTVRGFRRDGGSKVRTFLFFVVGRRIVDRSRRLRRPSVLKASSITEAVPCRQYLNPADQMIEREQRMRELSWVDRAMIEVLTDTERDAIAAEFLTAAPGSRDFKDDGSRTEKARRKNLSVAKAKLRKSVEIYRKEFEKERANDYSANRA